MTRIIAGTAGSVRMSVPPKGTRPTSDKVREAVFSTLDSWGFIENTRVLDLYAGSGALGLEAASRGANSVTLVERHAPAVAIMRKNAASVQHAFRNNAPSVNCVKASVRTFLETLAGSDPFDVVFIDPPYDLSHTEITENLEALAPHLAPDAAIVIERDARSTAPIWPAEYREIRSKHYGETVLYWLEPHQEETETPEYS